MTEPIDPGDSFTQHRALLFTVAYEMLGSAADAEDVVQETWLRWAEVERAEVRDPRAYLVRIVTRQALNRLRTLSRRREEYVGEWLPEPLLTAPDVAEDLELAESVSIAMLTVLETLGPVERAVFVLREVFGAPYGEIADAVDKTPAAVRQINRRARHRVAERRPRIRVSHAEQSAVVDRFMAAVRGGDLQALLDVLAPDVVIVADGGGKVEAAYRPISGENKVRALMALMLERSEEMDLTPVVVNGEPAIRLEIGRALIGVIGLAVADGTVTRLYVIGNPDKLTHLTDEVLLAR